MRQPMNIQRPGFRPNRERVQRPALPVIEVDLDSIDSWDVYRPLANHTESIPAKWSKESAFNLRFVHHMLGLVTEMNELIPTTDGLGVVAANAIEELGDQLWYMANLHTLSIQANQVQAMQMLEELPVLIVRATETEASYQGVVLGVAAIRANCEVLLDQAKRTHAYGDGSLPANYYDIAKRMVDTTVLAFKVAHFQGWPINLTEIMTANIAKLKKRYSAGFNAKEAVNRQLELEAEVFRQRKSGVGSVSSGPTPTLDIEGAEARQAAPTPANLRGSKCRSGDC